MIHAEGPAAHRAAHQLSKEEETLGAEQASKVVDTYSDACQSLGNKLVGCWAELWAVSESWAPLMCPGRFRIFLTTTVYGWEQRDTGSDEKRDTEYRPDHLSGQVWIG